MMMFILAGRAWEVFEELSLLDRLEKAIGHVLIKFRAEPWDNIQN